MSDALPEQNADYVAPAEAVAAPFHTWIPTPLSVCRICSAVVPPWPEAMQNHEMWHAKDGGESA